MHYETHPDDSTIIAQQDMIDSYCGAYREIYKRDAVVHYLGGGWYHVNGEVVHRVTFFLEIGRLHSLREEQRKVARTSVVNRLIAKLRGL